MIQREYIRNGWREKMKNTLNDFNNYLFEAMERLTDDSLSSDQLDQEIKRAESMSKVATQIIQTGELAYKTMVHMDEYGYGANRNNVPAMLEIKKDEK